MIGRLHGRSSTDRAAFAWQSRNCGQAPLPGGRAATDGQDFGVSWRAQFSAAFRFNICNFRRGTIRSRTDCLRQSFARSYSKLGRRRSTGHPVRRKLYGNADQPNIVKASVSREPGVGARLCFSRHFTYSGQPQRTDRRRAKTRQWYCHRRLRQLPG